MARPIKKFEFYTTPHLTGRSYVAKCRAEFSVLADVTRGATFCAFAMERSPVHSFAATGKFCDRPSSSDMPDFSDCPDFPGLVAGRKTASPAIGLRETVGGLSGEDLELQEDQCPGDIF